MCLRRRRFFPENDIKTIFTQPNDDDPKELVAKIGIALMYYGLLRQNEVLQIKIGDVDYKEDGEITIKFGYASKTRKIGFEYYVPEHLKCSFRKYIGQIRNPDQKVNTHFLKNWNVGGKTRIQNLGVKMVGDWIDVACAKLGVDVKGYSSHRFRRSAATVLVDNGCTIDNLKRHGRWTSDKVAEGYVDNSETMKMNQLLLLDSYHEKDHDAIDGLTPPKKKLAVAREINATIVGKPDASFDPSKLAAYGMRTTQGTVLYQNCNIITSHSLTLGSSSVQASDKIDIQRLFHQIQNNESKGSDGATDCDKCDDDDENVAEKA